MTFIFAKKYCFENKNKCLYFTDTRDKQRYAYVVIGEQTWMAENLNYNASGSKCYENEDANCDKYGRLYDWETALTACPSGWHLPSDDEWDVLVNYAGGSSVAGGELKATSGWWNSNGTDEFGFSALQGNGGSSDGYFFGASEGYWWGASEDENYSDYAYRRTMGGDNDYAYWSYDTKSQLFSVRCLQD